MYRLIGRGLLVYRLSTFPLIHANVIHAFFNVLALVPLLERFEAAHGSLVTFALFNGGRWPSVRDVLWIY